MKQFFIKYKQLIPVLILTLLSALSVVNALINIADWNYHFHLSIKQYVAFIVLIINYIAFFKYRTYYKYILIFSLLLGFSNFVNFTPYEIAGFIKLNSIKLHFQPFISLICIVTYIFNFRRVNELLIQTFKSPPEVAAKKETAEYTDQIEKFKKLYYNHSDEQLQTIIAEGRHINEAINAARQILTERKTIQHKIS